MESRTKRGYPCQNIRPTSSRSTLPVSLGWPSMQQARRSLTSPALTPPTNIHQMVDVRPACPCETRSAFFLFPKAITPYDESARQFGSIKKDKPKGDKGARSALVSIKRSEFRSFAVYFLSARTTFAANSLVPRMTFKCMISPTSIASKKS